MSVLAETFAIGLAASVISGLATAAVQSFLTARDRSKALAAANTDDFEAVLATGDLSDLGKILRERLGTVSLEALLNDSETQSKVYRSLQRLTEVVNQPTLEEPHTPTPAPAPVAVGEEAAAEPSPSSYWASDSRSPESMSTGKDYVDLLEENERTTIAHEISRITQLARVEIRISDIWTGLAGARRAMEMTMLPLLGGSRKSLSPRIFLNPRLRSAMGSFLGIANKAIHGEEVSYEDAERALRAADFIAKKLPFASLEADGTLPA